MSASETDSPSLFARYPRWRGMVMFITLFTAIVIAISPPSKEESSLRGQDMIAYASKSFPSHSWGVAKLDFYIAGFPKTGTTTLLKTFAAFHNETRMPLKEECSLKREKEDHVALANLEKDFINMTLDRSIKRGIKCPSALTTRDAIDLLEKWFPNTNLIVGLRHPVYFFQSFYNYKVNCVHHGRIKGPIPPAETLIGTTEWAKVSTEHARFEHVLRQLGKTQSDEYKATPFKVFLYTLEQMEDENVKRSEVWRVMLGSFLGLQSPIGPLQRSNVNHLVGKKGFNETIDICDSKFDLLRQILIQNGKETQRWIREEFLMSPDVTVANKEHFEEMLQEWKHDPCIDQTTRVAYELPYQP